MAVRADCYYSNAIVGVPQVAAGQVNVYKEDILPRFALGTKFERQDGAVFRYAQFGATVSSAGYLCHVDVSESMQNFQTTIGVQSSSTYQMPGENSGIYPNMKGSHFAVATLASIQTDQFAGGYMTISSGTVSGSYTYRIKGNTKTGDPVTGNVRIELYEPLVAGIGSSVGLTITPSRYSNLEASLPATGSDLPAGVTMIPITTANDFGWVQTKGIAGVLAGESTILANRAVTMSTEVAGAVEMFVVHTAGDITSLVRELTPVIGFSVNNSTAGTFIPIVLNID